MKTLRNLFAPIVVMAMLAASTATLASEPGSDAAQLDLSGSDGSASQDDVQLDLAIPGVFICRPEPVFPACQESGGIQLGAAHVDVPDVEDALPLSSSYAGMHSVAAVRVHNNTGTPLDLGWALDAGDPDAVYFHVSASKLEVAAGATQEVKVGYRPTEVGSHQVALTVTASHGTDVHTGNFTLRGQGVAGDALYRVNVGGSARSAASGSVWFTGDTAQAHSSYLASESSEVGVHLLTPLADPQPPSAVSGVPSYVSDDSILRLLRRSSSPGVDIDYWFPTINPGAHVIRVLFADQNLSGDRAIDMLVENQMVLDDFLITLAAGGVDKGVGRAFIVGADDVLDLSIRSVKAEGAKVSAIEVLQDPSISAVANSGVDFGPAIVNEAEVTRSLTISNPGNWTTPAIRVDSLTITGPDASDFTVDLGGSRWIAPGSSVDVPVTFSPSEQGGRSATVTASIWGGLSVSGDLTGSGVVPAGTLTSPASLAFGSVTVGDSVTRSVTVSNSTSATVHVGGAEISGDAYSIDESVFPFSLAPGQSKNLAVTFEPTTTGAESGTLRIEHTGTNRPSNVALSGTGEQRFVDTVGHVFADDVTWLASSGITRGCNPPVNDRFCPDDNVTRGQMAAFFVRALGLTETGSGFTDTEGHVFDGDIRKLAAAGITRGCNPPSNTRFCPDEQVTRGQMAAFFVRGLGLTLKGDGFTDTVGNVFENDINRFAAAGITRGCNPPSNTRFCPDDNVTRGQMAAFFHRAAAMLGLDG